MLCKRCNKEIQINERKFYSRQRGMIGWYHWNCYTVQVKIANEFGEREILYTGVTQSMVQPMGPTDNLESVFVGVNRVG